MALVENEMRVDDPMERGAFPTGTAGTGVLEAPSASDGEAEVLYPPGIKLFGEEKRRRDREIAETVRRHVDPTTGRLPASIAQQVYHDVGHRFGLSPSGVILRTPSEIKPTNLETLEYARSQKGKTPKEERAARPRRRRAQREERPQQEPRLKRRDATVQQRVREAARAFVNPATGRIPAADATRVYHQLAEQFQRTAGTVSNYLKGLTPTAAECAALRWERERERKGTGPRPVATRPAAVARPAGTEEIDYSAHPAALFPVAQPQAPPRRKPGDDPVPMKERVKTMTGPDGRLIDYDESYQVQRKGETVETKLDDATAEFLRSFRVQQASEMIDALRDCGRAMHNYVNHTQRYLQEFQQSIQTVGNQIAEVAGFTIQSLKESHRRDLQELREYIDALEEDNTRLNSQLNRARSILTPADEGSPAGERAGVGASSRSAGGRPSAARD
jgi:hypothetical protein